MTHKDVVPHSDITGESWIDSLPAPVVPYLKLMRLDRPIGIWLLLFPALWAIVLASNGIPNMGKMEWYLGFLFFMGAVVMRGAGCIINDLWDRDLDKRVERTRIRPLASGAIPIRHALALLCILLGGGFIILLQMNTPTIALGILSLLPVILYPLMKRIVWWPQLILGLTFNFGALMGWTAVKGQLDAPAIFLYCACIFWTLGYDTIYAHQDAEDDSQIGLKSTALKFGDRSPVFILFFYVMMVVFLTLTLKQLDISGGNAAIFMILALPTWHLLRQIKQLDIHDPRNCLERFKSNQITGLLILLCLALI